MMYRYTPVPRFSKMCRPCNYRQVERLLRYHGLDPDYDHHCALRRGYSGVSFHSPHAVSHVPVCGYLFPATMFNCEVIE